MAAYVRMIAAIVLAYGVIIGLGTTVAGPGRLLILAFLLWEAVRLRGHGIGRGALRIGVVVALATAIAAAVIPWASSAAVTVESGLVGGVSFLLTAAVIAVLVLAVIERPRVDTSMVLGVLSIYLLLALLFASLNQLLAAFDADGYLHGVAGPPTAADHLYFSVVTMATVGYGDIVPASRLARAVAVVEALTGQLYLVSVVAAVVGGWHGRRRAE